VRVRGHREVRVRGHREVTVKAQGEVRRRRRTQGGEDEGENTPGSSRSW
jgi:hypothetical protein